MENKENNDFSPEVKQILKNLKEEYDLEEEFKKEEYLIRLGLYTKDRNGIKKAKDVTEEEYQALLEYRNHVYEGVGNFAALLKEIGVLVLIAGIITGIAGLLSNSEIFLLVATLPGLIIYLILFGLGIVVQNSYKIK